MALADIVSAPQEDLGASASLLRLATAGSVDDGKSTLIGRLLYDSKQVLEDQMAHVVAVSERRGDANLNLALLTDGLRAEREQGITIDVAYRYFQTARRKFIIADTPGHEQYTRNMVTGASTADVALVLVDARAGLTEQTHRHAAISALLGIHHVVLCINKMDLVEWSATTAGAIESAFSDAATRLGIPTVTVVPMAALHGDNVVERSERMPWYTGPALLELLEELELPATGSLEDLRLPVQWVIRPHSDEHHDYRGYSGQLACGTVRRGQSVTVLPSGQHTTVAAIDHGASPLEEASAPLSITVQLADHLDVGRGDMIVSGESQPLVTRTLTADVCWLSERALQPNGRYLIKHTSRATPAVVSAIVHRRNVSSQEEQPAASLSLNDIGRVLIRTATPLVVDSYRACRETGAFILMDEATHDTVAAGMVISA